MDYDELVAKVIELLQREKRVPYRILKRRFDLDDDYIEDLKIDLIEAKRLAIDENDRILVWIGDITGSRLSSCSANTTACCPGTASPSGRHLVPMLPPPDAERRQLTVMFCDLVDSTNSPANSIPKTTGTWCVRIKQVCTEVIQRYEGHIAQLLGDGLLVYFGYPHAHEDDAQRAVRTGLEIFDAMGDLNTRLQQDKGIQLRCASGHSYWTGRRWCDGRCKDDRNSWHWGKSQTCVRASKGWLSPTLSL